MGINVGTQGEEGTLAWFPVMLACSHLWPLAVLYHKGTECLTDMAACSELDLFLSDSCVSFLTVPAAPTNLILTNPGSSSELYMCWNKPPGRRDHYRVILYSLSNQGRDRVQTLSPDAQNITWTHLEAGSRFAVQVTAVKGSFEASSTNVTQWTCESDGLGWT